MSPFAVMEPESELPEAACGDAANLLVLATSKFDTPPSNACSHQLSWCGDADIASGEQIIHRQSTFG